MSIAVSAVVGPSRLLRALVAAFGLANLAAAFAVGVLLPGRFEFAQLSSIFFLSAGAFLLHGCGALTKTRQIDISGLGQLRVTVQQDMRTGVAAGRAAPCGTPAAGAVALLLPGSTVWPQLMLLRLSTGSGARLDLPVLRDSVAPGVFRALAVAFGAIGGRNRQ